MFDFISSSFSQLLMFVEGIDTIYIYLVLFGMAFFENIFPPIPGDTFTIIGGYLAAAGKLSLPITLTTLAIGTMASIMLVYALGFHGGRDFFLKKKLRIFNASDMGQVDTWFNRFGIWTLLFSRFVVGGRVAIALGAGMSKYPPVRMTLYSLISTVAFHGTLIGLSFLMYTYINSLVDGFNLYSKIILVILTVLVIIWIIFIVRRFKNGKKKA
jgi:membrane protein DedA with SNARE-associated domain